MKLYKEYLEESSSRGEYLEESGGLAFKIIDVLGKSLMAVFVGWIVLLIIGIIYIFLLS